MQTTLRLYARGDFFAGLIRQKIKEDAFKLAYEDVRELFRESRERGEDWVKWQTKTP